MKLNVDVPPPGELLADVNVPYEPLRRAEQAVTAAEHRLAAARAELAAAERRVVELPALIAMGNAAPSTLIVALRERDATALMLAPLERAVDEAKTRISIEQKRAREVLEHAVAERLERLRATANQLVPVLEALRDAERALGCVLDSDSLGMGITWPDCWPTTIALGNARMMANQTGPVTQWPWARRQ